MLLIQNLHTDKEAIKLRLAKRGTDFSALIDHAIALDNQRKEIQTQLDDILAQSNQLAKSIGQLFAQKKNRGSYPSQIRNRKFKGAKFCPE